MATGEAGSTIAIGFANGSFDGLGVLEFGTPRAPYLAGDTGYAVSRVMAIGIMFGFENLIGAPDAL